MQDRRRGLGLADDNGVAGDAVTYAAQRERFRFGDYLKEQMDPSTPGGKWERENARSDGKPPALTRGVDDPKRRQMYDMFYDEAARQYSRIPPKPYGGQWDTPEAEQWRNRMRGLGRSKGLSDAEIDSIFRYLRSLSD